MKQSLFAALCGVLLTTPAFAAAPGVTNEAIRLGQSCALEGPAAALGTGMRDGMLAYFAMINEQGGVHNRRVELVSKNDGYEPDAAIKNAQEFIDGDDVLLMIGEVGTPTSKAVVPITERAKVPFFGPFTGAEFLRLPPYQRYVVNVRGSYYQEMERLTQYLVDQQGMKSIACFYQNDGYGQAGLAGIQLALEKRGMELSATGTYERNTTAVKSGLLSVRRGKPEAVVMVGAYKPCAEFIKLARKMGMDDVTYCNISFVGTEALRTELGDAGEGCVISQVVHFPWDDSVPMIKEYLSTMQKYNPEAKVGFVSLEGFMVAKLFCEIAASVEGELTRESFLDAIFAKGTFDLGGVQLTYGAEDNQGMDQVYLTVIKDGRIQPLE